MKMNRKKKKKSLLSFMLVVVVIFPALAFGLVYCLIKSQYKIVSPASSMGLILLISWAIILLGLGIAVLFRFTISNRRF